MKMPFKLSSTHKPISGYCENLPYFLHLLNRSKNYYYFILTLIPYFSKENIDTMTNAGIRKIIWNTVSEKKREMIIYLKELLQ